MIDALEAYLRVAPPPGLGLETSPAQPQAQTMATALATPAEFETIAIKVIDAEPAVAAEGQAITGATTEVDSRRGERAEAPADDEREDGAGRPTGS